MKIKTRTKLKLIDNYISIYRALYNCKILLLNNKNDQSSVLRICDQALDLKNKYEYAFEKLNMIDTSFLILKQQLNSIELSEMSYKNSFSLSDIISDLSFIETTYTALNLK